MSVLDDAVASNPPPDRGATRIHEHPKGWEPGVSWDPTSGRGHITATAMDEEITAGIWKELIADWGLDPKYIGIVEGTVQVRGWDMNVSEGTGDNRFRSVRRMKYYRATLTALSHAHDRADVDALITDIARRKPLARKLETDAANRALIVGLSDFQVGKGEGDGSAGTVQRILDSLDNLVAHVRTLHKARRPVDTVYLCGLGDLVEQCSGHYAMQAFQVDLDRREQMRVVRRLLLKYVDALLPLVDRVVLVAIPGNHGENRNSDGKAYTTFTDNDDLAVFDGIAEVAHANPERYGRVSVMIADTLSTTFEAAGVVIGITHMHQGRRGGTVQQKVLNWWAGHALGRGRVHDADILITGHYHHLVIDESCGRTWFQCPAQDPGSAWFTEATGQHSATGMLAFCVSDEHYGARKWGDMVIL